MAWNPHTDPLPTEAELEEPYRRVDQLVGWLLEEDDEELSRWAIETLAGGLGLLAVVTDPYGDVLASVRTLSTALADSDAFLKPRGTVTREQVRDEVVQGFLEALAALHGSAR